MLACGDVFVFGAGSFPMTMLTLPSDGTVENALVSIEDPAPRTILPDVVFVLTRLTLPACAVKLPLRVKVPLLVCTVIDPLLVEMLKMSTAPVAVAVKLPAELPLILMAP